MFTYIRKGEKIIKKCPNCGHGRRLNVKETIVYNMMDSISELSPKEIKRLFKELGYEKDNKEEENNRKAYYQLTGNDIAI